MTATTARWPHLVTNDPDPTETSELHDALRDLPTADPWRAAWLRDRVAVLSGGVR